MARSLSERDAQSVLHGYVEFSRQREHGSTAIVRGEGIYVFDEAGTPYLEAAAGMWCTSFGFSEPALVDAALEQLRVLPYYHTVAYKSVEPAIELAERLAGLCPMANAKVYFSLSGSEANDFLVRAVRYYNNALGRPQKKKIIARQYGYHGATLVSASLTGVPVNHRGFDLPLPGFIHVSDPNFYRNGLPGETREEFCGRMADELESVILAEGPDTVAAFMAEPVTGAGGVVVPPKGYYARITEVLDRHDVLFLDDEVITGLYRTGELWGCRTMGFVPDTMTLAKGLTSAYQPLAAVLVDEEFYEGLERGTVESGLFGHGSTYSGHPVACAVAMKVLDLIEERDIAAHVARVGRVFGQRLMQFRDHPLVGDVRFCGLMGAVEFVADKTTGKPFEPVGSFAKRVRDHAEDRHQLICRALPGVDACAFSPPLIITEREVDDLFDRFARALADVAAEPGGRHSAGR